MRTPSRAPAAAGACLALLLLFAAAPPALAVRVTCGTASGLAGATVDVALTTTSVTGAGVVAMQFDLQYNPNVVTPVAVLEAGSLTGGAAWGNPTFSIQPLNASAARLSVSDAGTTALSGAGTLITLRFALEPTLLGGGSTALTFTNFVFNEGSPADTTSNGSITVNVTPQITVSPQAATVYRTSTQQFSVSGGVTNPVSWATTDASIATISATGLLTGVAPGFVRVFAVDAAARRDTTDNLVEVRGMRVSAGVGSVVQGNSTNLGISTTSLTGLGVRSGQVTLLYNSSLLTPTAVTAPAGTLLAGYGPLGFGIPTPGTLVVDFAGASNLSGSGTLFQVTFAASSVNTGFSAVNVTSALFNETLPAVTQNGSVTVTGLGTLTVTPDQVTLLAGQTQSFAANGIPTPTPPIAWSVTDPTVASINAAGLLTALSGGDTQVRAQDALGALDFNTAVRVYDFAVTLGTVQAVPGATVRLPLTSDRTVGHLGIHSLQYTLQWSGTAITNAQSTNTGLCGPWQPTGVVSLFSDPRIQVAGAGATALDASGTELHSVQFTISPAAVPGTNIPVTLSALIFNEGLPRATITSGVIQVRNTVDAPPARGEVLELAPSRPNPMRGGGRFRFSLPEVSPRVRLTLHALDGRLVRELEHGGLAAGEHERKWDGRDLAGRTVAAGVYLCRLEVDGRTLTRKFALMR